MTLRIDGRPLEAMPNQSLLEIIRAAGMDVASLSERPLAARIAGETFTLNYVPQRPVSSGVESPAPLRRAIAASRGEIRLIRYGEDRGKRVYERTALFVLLLAIHRLYPDAAAQVNYSVGNALNITVQKDPSFDGAAVDSVREEMKRLIEADIPLLRRRVTTEQAARIFSGCGQQDKARLLHWRKADYFDLYQYEDFAEYFYGEMAPSTGYVSVWALQETPQGLMLIFPDSQNPDRVSPLRNMPNFSAAFSQGERWGQLMHCAVVADLNRLTESGKIRELIRVNEALHERSFSRVADTISTRGIKAALIAGPSSSGKTTSANRLAVQLRVHGKEPILISLDDYYIDRDKIMPQPDGTLDLEHINTIDVVRFRHDLLTLLSGGEVCPPRFDFLQQKSIHGERTIRLTQDSVILIEGLHGLNPVLLPEHVNRELVFRMYVSALLPLNLDWHNRIPSTQLRLLRRIVRDHETRGASVERTLSMWDSVRAGEERWIFPYQENADVIFNSSLVYEMAVLKKYIYPLLMQVQPESPYYAEIRSLVKFLNYVQEADADDEIPPTSILREFIGGNTFYR